PEQLDFFRPQIVISMMGTNDQDALLTVAHPSWFDSLRTVRVFRLLALDLPRLWSLRGTRWPSPGEIAAVHPSDEIASRLKSQDAAKALPLIDEQRQPMNASERSLYYLALASEMDPDGSATGSRAEVELELLHRSRAARIQPIGVGVFARLLSRMHRED